MSAEHLAEIVRWVGVIVAFVASLIATPAATRTLALLGLSPDNLGLPTYIGGATSS